MARNFDFYELNESGGLVPPSQASPVRSGMVIALGALGGLVVITIGVVVLMNIVRNAEVKNDLATQSQIERSAQDCIDAGGSEEACFGVAQMVIAEEAQSVEACDGLQKKAYVDCVTVIAMDQFDTKACKSLEGGDKRECEDKVAFVTAVVSDGECSAIGSDSLRENCENQKSGGQSFEDVVENGKASDCARFEEYEKACLDFFHILDSDDDGLSDYDEEVIYKTDRKNADTDGDGFNDGEEVQNNFDPLQ